MLRFHPWIFSGAIAHIEGKPSEGDLVEVYSAGRSFLGIGHYQIGSIAVRLLSLEPVSIDHAFWTERIRTACRVRRMLGLAGRVSDIGKTRTINQDNCKILEDKD